VRIGQPADGQQHLVLLGLESGGFGGMIAAAEELADAIAQFGQGGVFRLANPSLHAQIISSYDINASPAMQARLRLHLGAFRPHLTW